MKAAAVQMTSTRDIAANLREAGRLVTEAASQGAELVVLPENFSFLGATDADRVAAIEPVGDGPAQHFLAETAKRHGLFIVGGTIPICGGGQRASSRSLLVGPDGEVAAYYDKIHLFDVDIPGRATTARDGGRAANAGSDLRPTARDGGRAANAGEGMDARGRATQARAGTPEVEQRMEQLPGAVAGSDLRPTARDGGSAANAGSDLRPERYSESATTLAGTRVVAAPTPHARIGMTV